MLRITHISISDKKKCHQVWIEIITSCTIAGTDECTPGILLMINMYIVIEKQ